MSQNKLKMIKVLSVDYIHEYGQAHGPLLTPFNEKVEVIGRMVRRGIKVNEVLADGSEVELTEENYADGVEQEETTPTPPPVPPTPPVEPEEPSEQNPGETRSEQNNVNQKQQQKNQKK